MVNDNDRRCLFFSLSLIWVHARTFKVEYNKSDVAFEVQGMGARRDID